MSVACANRAVHGFAPGQQAHHETVAQVRLCFSREGGLPSIEEADQHAQDEAQARSELAAEAANERFFEEGLGGGYYAGSPEEARDRYFDSLTEEVAQVAEIPWEQAEGQTPALSPAQVFAAEPLRDGIYTLQTASGHRTLRLRTQASDDKFKPGEQIVAFLSGSDNERDYTGFGTTTNGVLKVWARHRGNADLVADANALLADPGAALVSAECYRCHRTLTTPDSIQAGIGPECQKKGI